MTLYYTLLPRPFSRNIPDTYGHLIWPYQMFAGTNPGRHYNLKQSSAKFGKTIRFRTENATKQCFIRKCATLVVVIRLSPTKIIKM